MNLNPDNLTEQQDTLVQQTVDLLQKRLGTEFGTDGGCGVVASLLADVCRAHGETGDLVLILRESEDGDERWVSHIAFEHHASQGLYDINGSQADERWMEKITRECQSMGEPEPCFEWETVSLANEPDIQRTLHQLTLDHGLNVRPDWISLHYETLRADLEQAAGLGRPNPDDDEDALASTLADDEDEYDDLGPTPA